MITLQQREQVIEEALTWLKTPYHHRASCKGAGVDCGLFPLAVYQKFALLKDVKLPQYSAQWHLHQNEELYLKTVEELGGVPTDDLDPANFIVFKIGRTFSHGAIILQWPTVIHSLHPSGVIESDATIEAVLTGKPFKVFHV